MIKHIVHGKAEMCFSVFYRCLLKIIASATIKANAKIVNAINALKSMYIIVNK